MSGPEINIQKSKFDKVIEITSFLLILGSALLIVLSYQQLPDRLPIYFNWPSKDKEGFGSKDILWLSPVISGAIVLVIINLNKRPSLFNYPVGITSVNAAVSYKMATQMLRIVGLIIALWCLVLTLMSVLDGLGNPIGFSPYAGYLFPVLLVALPVFYMIRIVWYKGK